MNIEDIRAKLFLTFDKNSGYTMDDFNKEFSNQNQIKTDYKLIVKFNNKSNNPNPEYSTEEASGFDIRAFLDKPLILKSGTVELIPTGLYFDIPSNMEIQIRPRSGLASKGIVCNFGTVDSDYTGEVKAILFNLTKEDFTINNGDRVAQGIVATKLAKQIITLEKVDKIEKITDRAGNGFGSTGVN